MAILELLAMLLLFAWPIANVIVRMNCAGSGCAGCDSCGGPICSGAGCGYTVQTGTASVSDDVITITSANTIVTSDTEDASGGIAVKVSCYVQASASGDGAKLIFKRKDANNYWFAYAEFGSSGLLRIYQVISGANNFRAGLSIALGTTTSYKFEACYGNGRVTTTLNSASVSYTTTTNVTDAPGAGVGSWPLSGSSIVFTQFRYEYGQDADTHPNCPTCDPPGAVTCDSHAIHCWKDDIAPDQIDLWLFGDAWTDSSCDNCANVTAGGPYTHSQVDPGTVSPPPSFAGLALTCYGQGAGIGYAPLWMYEDDSFCSGYRLRIFLTYSCLGINCTTPGASGCRWWCTVEVRPTDGGGTGYSSHDYYFPANGEVLPQLDAADFLTTLDAYSYFHSTPTYPCVQPTTNTWAMVANH